MRHSPRDSQAISTLWAEGFVGHEREADQRLRCGSTLGVVNVADHL
jgi:hypothetical protein